MGNQAMQRRLIQAKLPGNQPGDSFEQEPDRVEELTDHGSGPMLLSAATPSQNAGGGLQRLDGNQSMLQLSHGSGDLPVLAVPLCPSQSGILQRKCACDGSAGMSGECEECGEKQRLGLQTKLKVNEPGDIYEREADRIADQVMATPAPPAVSGAPPRIQRFAVQPTVQAEAVPASVEQAVASPGRPLEPALRQDMEQRFGHDFSRVRVHTDAAAEQSARDVNAHAYTVGHNMVFGTDQFVPETQEGRRLLAHELTHVVQQSAQGSARSDRLSIAAPDINSEHEAERAAVSALSNRPYPIYHRSPQGTVQRQMCTDILNAEEVRGVTRGVEVERQVRVDLIMQLGAQNVMPLFIPGASARLYRMEDCGGFQTTQPPGGGIPDLAYINGRNVELAEVKIGTWPCLHLAETQVDKYVEVANGNKAFKQRLGVNEFELMPTSRFIPSQLRAPDGTPVNVGWCSPGVIVYKAIASSNDETYLCGAISDKGRLDRFLDRMLGQGEKAVDQYLDQTIDATITKNIQTLTVREALGLMSKYDPGWMDNVMHMPRAMVGEVGRAFLGPAGSVITSGWTNEKIVNGIADFLDSAIGESDLRSLANSLKPKILGMLRKEMKAMLRQALQQTLNAACATAAATATISVAELLKRLQKDLPTIMVPAFVAVAKQLATELGVLMTMAIAVAFAIVVLVALLLALLIYFLAEAVAAGVAALATTLIAAITPLIEALMMGLAGFALAS
jgi:hypothetical protein